MRGFQYKDKEGVEMFLEKSYVNASFTLSKLRQRGVLLYSRKHILLNNMLAGTDLFE